MKNIKRRMLAGFAVGVLIVLMTCTMSCKLFDELGLGGFSQADAEAFAQSLSDALAASMASMQGFPKQVAQAGDGPCKSASNLIYFPIDHYYTCASGGTMHVIGDISGSLSDYGTGMLQIGLSIIIHSCQCDPDSDIITTNPYISVAGTFPYVNWMPGAQRMEIGGSFMAGSKACNIQVTINFNGNSAHISGSICNKFIDMTV